MQPCEHENECFFISCGIGMCKGWTQSSAGMMYIAYKCSAILPLV